MLCRSVEFTPGRRERARKRMTCLKTICFSLALLLLQEKRHCVVSYLGPVSYRAKQKFSFRLRSSPNIFLGSVSTNRSDDSENNPDTNECDRTVILRAKYPQQNVEFSNFWGTKLTTNEEMADSTIVPFVPTLDDFYGPLPSGSYIMEGKPEFDAKSTCRISIDVNAGNDGTFDESDVVRRLHDCVDAGFNTFQLHNQTSRSLGIIRNMNDNTPSYINTHWSIGWNIHPSTDRAKLPTKNDVRHSILNLVEQTGSDALDSLIVDCGNMHAMPSHAPVDISLEVFDYLVDLQREGWLRSIGVRNIGSQKLEQELTTYFGHNIDFEEQEGNLLVPPFSSGPYNSKRNIRMANALAGGLLTDLCSDDYRLQRKKDRSKSHSRPFLTNDNIDLLKGWAKYHELENESISKKLSIWEHYQQNFVKQLNWIAMKHDVSMSAVALRWALEYGGSVRDTRGEGLLISSAMADIEFDDPRNEIAKKLVEIRQVFRFEFDEDDRLILSRLSASQYNESPNNERDDLDIDFNDPKLWL